MSNNGTATAFLWIHALTPLHPGSGTALGVVDLPVQRERHTQRHTQWPTIPGSSLKGVLRDAYRRGGNGQGDGGKASVEVVFGPDVGEAEKHAGAVSITDARLFAFPVRSLQGVFAWVTSPGVLQRFKSDLALANQQGGQSSWAVPELPQGKAVAHSKSPLAIVDDDTFTHFARYSTEVTARIGLDYEHKTVRQGALFYQEFLPAECVFYLFYRSAEMKPLVKAFAPCESTDYLDSQGEGIGYERV